MRTRTSTHTPTNFTGRHIAAMATADQYETQILPGSKHSRPLVRTLALLTASLNKPEPRFPGTRWYRLDLSASHSKYKHDRDYRQGTGCGTETAL